ncbi:MAG: hypothetical protein LUC30_06550 [Clostridiales bacterium]|nr:hypothetical protein [Clostridiales bacterium]
MAEFEEKLNEILSSPQAMEQIMSLANSLSGGSPPSETDASEGAAPSSAPADLLGGLEPATLGRLSSLLSVYQQQGDERTQLLEALRPFLKENSQERLERAVHITRISRVIQAALSMFRGDGDV